MGFLNRSRFGIARPIQQFKGRAWLNFSRDRHNARLIANYTGEYEDERRAPGQFGEKIDRHVTLDLVYNFSFNQGRTRVTAGVFNLADNEPPESAHELGYDPYTHSGLLRTWKLGVTHTMEEGTFGSLGGLLPR